jgi:hypothetical protein
VEILRLSDDPRLVLDCLAGVNFALAHQSRAYLGFDDLRGMLLRIYNGNDHERISFFITAPAVAASSLLLNERLICPSTFNRNRSSVGR